MMQTNWRTFSRFREIGWSPYGDRKGQYSIRINDRWRICFVWRDGTADHVEIVDYH
jgi:plasmid maintenance system killer protein